MSKRSKLKIIIDCDPGCDDAVALFYALGRPDLDVLSVIASPGNASAEITSRNAQAILRIAGRTDLKVYRGTSRPLKRPLETAVVHGTSALGALRVPKGHRVSPGGAKEILRQARKYPHTVTLVALAPLCTVAQAFLRDPKGFRQLKEILILGGTLRAPGNKGPVSEFNFYVDPEAARVVLRSGVPIRAILLDACYPVTLNLNDFSRLKSARLRRTLLQILRPYANLNFREEGIRGAIMYDPLAIFCLGRAGKLRGIPLRADVETRGEITRGMLVIDQRRRAQGPKNVRAITSIDKREFLQSLLHSLARLQQ